MLPNEICNLILEYIYSENVHHISKQNLREIYNIKIIIEYNLNNVIVCSKIKYVEQKYEIIDNTDVKDQDENKDEDNIHIKNFIMKKKNKVEHTKMFTNAIFMFNHNVYKLQCHICLALFEIKQLLFYVDEDDNIITYCNDCIKYTHNDIKNIFQY